MNILNFIQTASAVETELGPAKNLSEYLSNIFNWIIPIVGGLAVLMLIYAGYKYITSQGNPEAISQAKDIIIGVITGIVLLFLIEIILRQIGI